MAKSLDFLAEESSDLLAKGELRAVVAAGGDGTVAEVINRCPVGTPVAVLPMGTENLLAKYLEIGPSPAALGQIIAQGQAAWLDAGRANGRLFLLMASIGFDAEVVRQLHATRDGNIRRWSYAKPILNTIRTYSYPELRVHSGPMAARKARSSVADGHLCSTYLVMDSDCVLCPRPSAPMASSIYVLSREAAFGGRCDIWWR